ncbi:hypothetical protein SDC9_143616 [bioreactor metagenome]|uniref:Uncharacterized protein n=1 Tax=bioreactor metagenome TaxID=1076179 RepID=A0A645E6L8_9ZZZZ
MENTRGGSSSNATVGSTANGVVIIVAVSADLGVEVDYLAFEVRIVLGVERSPVDDTVIRRQADDGANDLQVERNARHNRRCRGDGDRFAVSKSRSAAYERENHNQSQYDSGKLFHGFSP